MIRLHERCNSIRKALFSLNTWKNISIYSQNNIVKQEIRFQLLMMSLSESIINEYKKVPTMKNNNREQLRVQIYKKRAKHKSIFYLGQLTDIEQPRPDLNNHNTITNI